MSKRQLPQIKIFFLCNYSIPDALEKAVNDYIVEFFSTHGNYPEIHTNSKYISVISSRLIEIEENYKKDTVL